MRPPLEDPELYPIVIGFVEDGIVQGKGGLAGMLAEPRAVQERLPLPVLFRFSNLAVQEDGVVDEWVLRAGDEEYGREVSQDVFRAKDGRDVIVRPDVGQVSGSDLHE